MKPETRLQINVVSWVKETYPEVLFTSTQAGDRRSPLAAMIMKRMGYTNGTPDLIFFEAKNGWHGLMVELKENAKQSDSQVQFMIKARKKGYAYEIAHGIDQAHDVIRNYLGSGV